MVTRIMYAYPYPSIHSGSPRALLDLLSNLDRALFVPHLLTSQEGELSAASRRIGVCVSIGKSTCLSKANPHLFVWSVLKFIFLLRRHLINVLHVNEIGWRDSYVMAAKILKIPIILHLHLHYNQSTIKSNINLKCAKKIIVVSETLKEVFRPYQDIHSKLLCIHNGVDLRVFKKEDDIRDLLGIDKDKFVIGLVSQIRKEKGIEYVIHASTEILKRFPNTLFLIVGKKVAQEEGLTEELMGLTRNLGVDYAFRFLGRRDDVPAIMNSIDLMVLPTLSEAFGKVIIESMACHKCVIATKVGGIPEIIEDGKNGLLVPPKDVRSLENAILRVMEDKELRTSLAEAGHRTVAEKFSMTRQVEKIQNLYASLVG